MAKAGRKKKPRPIERLDVTPERASRNSIVSAGMARRIVPVIDLLWENGHITEAEYCSLAHYRNQASQAEDDTCQMNVLAPEKIMGGGSHGSHPAGGYTPATMICTPAILETARIERDLGSLLAIARAVAVDDVSLAQWCIAQWGGRERYNAAGRMVAIVPVNEKRHIAIARQDLRMAAHRITR